MRRPFGTKAAAALVAVMMGAGILGTTAPASADHRTTHVVRPGESIQAAIDAAHPGDKIKIKAGTYHENVYVNKDGIELEGAGAHKTFLLPPAVANPNPCTDPSGIFGAVCVGFGQAPVRGFELEGMTISHFLNGAFLVNTAGAEIERMIFANNSEYGAFYNSSTGGRIHHNVAYGSGEAGLYVGDSPNATVKVEDNEVYDNGNGMLLRDASNGTAEDNDAHDNCIGILVLNTGEPGAAAGWKIHHNDVNHNNNACPASDEAPPTSGAGIVLAGATSSTVWHNDVHGNVASGPSPLAAGGIVLVSTVDFGGTSASDNLVRKNDLSRNQPFDLSDDTTGTGNRFVRNDCTTSQPPGLCGGH